MIVRMVMQPNRCIVLGGTWRTPVAVGLQQKTFITDQKEEGTYNEASFDREYESKWSGSSEDSFFRADIIDKSRKLLQAEKESSGRNKNGFYILSMDVGRTRCPSVVCVFKVTPQPQGVSIKSLVNIYTFDDDHFEDQAIKIKRLFYQYNAKRLVIDANGLGIGLMDYMIKPQVIPETGEIIPDFGVYNDDKGEYKKYKTSNCEQEAIYIIKATAPINTEAHANAQAQLSSGKVLMLVDERTAKNNLLATRVGELMTPEERAERLIPYTLTSVLRDEMLNLRQERDGVNIILSPANNSIRKDKFSAFEYGLYYIKNEEDNNKKKKFNAKNFFFMN